ncbi:hypothetical protein [Coxiella endosymbiont of Ornithodoros maritimus]|uniref:hypothetical protein n=1 Tax=Coxiella endosymbiont of Ornithodoros maritimus TaxID=1656172 RepID=UPI00226541EB|nr:hypothetical protein [Coxiella endosymbiont of Ornithodoros maritimus]
MATAWFSLNLAADFLDSLNILIRLTPQEAKNVLKERGFVFFYAPDYHPAMKLIA